MKDAIVMDKGIVRGYLDLRPSRDGLWKTVKVILLDSRTLGLSSKISRLSFVILAVDVHIKFLVPDRVPSILLFTRLVLYFTSFYS